MNTESNTPTTLQDAIKHFANHDNAHAFWVGVRWPGGQVCCLNCGSLRVRYIQTRRQWECREKHPKRRFSLKTGTIMEDSPLPLEKWTAALWVEVNCKNSISSWEVHRALGVTQKTAWFMLHRIRHALHVGSFDKRLSGAVEVDETFIGGRSEFMHKSKRRVRIHGGGPMDKTAVVGLLERHSGNKHSTIRARVFKGHPNKDSLHEIIHRNVQGGSELYTDTHAGYAGLGAYYAHRFVDHAEAYVKDKVVHTNGLENFWSLFKRCIKGTHVAIAPCHLFRYVDSEAYRFNNRKLDDRGRFLGAANSITGKRLMYKELINTSWEGYTSSGN
jgi:hypothetical protein